MFLKSVMRWEWVWKCYGNRGEARKRVLRWTGDVVCSELASRSCKGLTLVRGFLVEESYKCFVEHLVVSEPLKMNPNPNLFVCTFVQGK